MAQPQVNQHHIPTILDFYDEHESVYIISRVYEGDKYALKSINPNTWVKYPKKCITFGSEFNAETYKELFFKEIEDSQLEIERVNSGELYG